MGYIKRSSSIQSKYLNSMIYLTTVIVNEFLNHFWKSILVKKVANEDEVFLKIWFFFQWYRYCYQYLYFTMDCWGCCIHFQFSLSGFCGWKQLCFGQIFHTFYDRVYNHCSASLLSQWWYWIQDWCGWKWIFHCS